MVHGDNSGGTNVGFGVGVVNPVAATMVWKQSCRMDRRRVPNQTGSMVVVANCAGIGRKKADEGRNDRNRVFLFIPMIMRCLQLVHLVVFCPMHLLTHLALRHGFLSVTISPDEWGSFLQGVVLTVLTDAQYPERLILNELRDEETLHYTLVLGGAVSWRNLASLS